MRVLFLIIILLSATALPEIAYAQDSEEMCITLVRDALDLTRETCESTTGRNQACYGNITLQVEPQPGINELTFEQRGDIVDVESIRTLQLSSMNRDANEWGVAYLRLQTSIEDVVTEDVTLLMFGDVTIENAVEPIPDITTLDITATGNINVRSGPSTNYAVVTALPPNQTVVADGRIEDGSWLRIQLDDQTTGWVFTQLMSVEGDPALLDIVATDSQSIIPKFGPMQAFFIETGSDDAPCAEAPDSGLLVQTPEGVAEISLVVNEVEIRLRSTVYLQSQPNTDLIVNVLEGSATVSAQDDTVTAPSGTRVRVPMTADNIASGPPSPPEPYDNTQINVLPVDALPQTTQIITALTQEEIDEATAIEPQLGTWKLTALAQNVSYSGECPQEIYDNVWFTPTDWERFVEVYIDENGRLGMQLGAGGDWMFEYKTGNNWYDPYIDNGDGEYEELIFTDVSNAQISRGHVLGYSFEIEGYDLYKCIMNDILSMTYVD